jgi:hypothetical protein
MAPNMFDLKGMKIMIKAILQFRNWFQPRPDLLTDPGAPDEQPA